MGARVCDVHIGRGVVRDVVAYTHVPPTQPRLSQTKPHSGANGPVRVNPLGALQWGEMVFTKLFWAAWRILLPLCHPAFHTSHAVVRARGV